MIMIGLVSAGVSHTSPVRYWSVVCCSFVVVLYFGVLHVGVLNVCVGVLRIVVVFHIDMCVSLV